jgi:hypothetical protein
MKHAAFLIEVAIGVSVMAVFAFALLLWSL